MDRSAREMGVIHRECHDKEREEQQQDAERRRASRTARFSVGVSITSKIEEGRLGVGVCSKAPRLGEDTSGFGLKKDLVLVLILLRRKKDADDLSPQ